MTLLTTTEPRAAEGKLKALYQQVEGMMGHVPDNVKLFGISPAVLESQLSMIDYYGGHATLSFEVFTLIRYMVSDVCGNDFCVNFNAGLLSQMGYDQRQLQDALEKQQSGRLEPKENQLLNFVYRAIKTPEEVSNEDIASLKTAGWEEQDIFDAVEHGARMVYSGHLFKAFKLHAAP